MAKFVYTTTHPKYPDRSPEFTGLIARIQSIMTEYQGIQARGSIGTRKELLMPGYGWSRRPVSINLREADGYHGGDVLGILEQGLLEQRRLTAEFLTGKPPKLGVVTYEGGNGSLLAYAIFDLRCHNDYTTIIYQPPRKIANGTSSDSEKPPISLEQFLASIYKLRNTVPLRDLKPEVNLRSHLERRGFRWRGRLK